MGSAFVLWTERMHTTLRHCVGSLENLGYFQGSSIPCRKAKQVMCPRCWDKVEAIPSAG